MPAFQTNGVKPSNGIDLDLKEANFTKIAALLRPNSVTFDARVHGRTESADTINLVLRDDGHFITASIEPALVDSETLKLVRGVTLESIVRISGFVKSNHGEAAAAPEVQITNFVVRADTLSGIPKSIVSHGAPNEMTSQKNSMGAIFLNERLNNRVADVRVAATGAIFKLLSGIFQLSTEHQTRNGFNWINTPGLINYKLPGDDDYFPVSYFDQEHVYLAQTGEFHQHMALAMDLKRVFEIRNAFRRERKVSSRHLTEYTAFEVTMAIDNDWHEVLYNAESLLIFIIRNLQEREQYRNLLTLAKRLYSSAGDFKLGLTEDGHFPSLTFFEAKALLREHSEFESSRDDEDFSREEETALGRLMRSPSKTASIEGPPTDMLIVTDWPCHLRPFNVHKKPGDDQITNSFDVILRGQETCSGWQSINLHGMLREAMVSRDPPIDPDAPMWRSYVGAYEAGIPPQGGYGMGLNRLLQNILGLPDIHEAALFPRNAQRLAP